MTPAPATAAVTVQRSARLPPLAWLLDLAEPGARVVCGASVALWDDGVFEGAWDGDFAAAGFDTAEDVFGSGARQTPDGWLLVPPSHMLEPVYLAEAADGRIVAAANSLPLLLAATGASLLDDGETLTPVLLHFMRGIDEPPARLATDQGGVLIAYFDNVLLTPAGPVRRRKPAPAGFADFAAVRARLRDTLTRVAANAQDPRRPRGYAMLASISSGFDSPAAAAIARDVGCREAATFVNGRGGDSDDGTPVAEALGLAVHRVTRPAGTRDLAAFEPEFLGAGLQGEDIVYACWRHLLPGRLLVSGFLGDFWRAGGEVNEQLAKTDGSGSGLGEYRLRTDFIHVALPTIGLRRHRDLLAIAGSEAMRPWRQPGSYTNPIARRIAEEAGVPRAVFGQTKKAVSLLGFHDPRLFSPGLNAGVAALLAIRGAPARLGYALRRRRYRVLLVLRYAGKALSERLPTPLDRAVAVANSRLFEWLRGQPARIAEHCDPFMGLAFEWACARMVARCRAELADPARG